MRKFLFPLRYNEAISLANLLTEEPKLFVRDTYYFLGHMDGINTICIRFLVHRDYLNKSINLKIMT